MVKKKYGSVCSSLTAWYHKCDNNVFKLDWILFIILLIFCYVSFVQGDIMNTGGRSWVLWRSNFFNYYDIVRDWTGDWGANYMPTTFWLFGIWVLPLKLLGFAPPEYVYDNTFIYNMWYKLLPVLFYAGSAFLIYKISVQIGFNPMKAKVCMLSFMTLPTVIYSQFIFSQYDIFTVFFMLLGIYFYLRNRKNDKWLFCIWFGISFTLKYYSLLIFAIFILIGEKRVWQLIKQTVVALLPLIFEVSIYIGSSCFRKSVFGFGAVGYISQPDFVTGIGTVSFCKIVCCIMVVWAYFVHPKDKDEMIKWALYLSCGVCFGIFGLATWHPQWLMFAAPFWVLSAATSKHTEKFLWLDIVFCIVFYMITIRCWVSNADDQTLYGGIWRLLLRNKTIYRHMNELIPAIDANTMFSVLFVLLLAFFVFKHPKFSLDKLSDDNGNYNMWIIRLRAFVAVFAFAVPAFAAMIIAVNANYVSTGSADARTWVPLYSGTSCEQYFTGADGKLKTIGLFTATNNQNNSCNLKIDVIDASTDKVLETAVAVSEKIPNCARYNFDFSCDTEFQKNKDYKIKIYSTDATDGNVFYIGLAPDTSPDDACYAELNNVDEDDYDAAVIGESYDCGALITLSK